MDGAAARPSRTSACVLLPEWAADELFCREGWNGLDRSATQVPGIIPSLSDASHCRLYDFACVVMSAHVKKKKKREKNCKMKTCRI